MKQTRVVKLCDLQFPDFQANVLSTSCGLLLHAELAKTGIAWVKWALAG